MDIKPFIEYNYIGEVAGLLNAGILLFVMLYTKPKKTFVYRYIFYGNILSIVAMLLQISIINVANNPEKLFHKHLFITQMLLFLIIYNGILYCIFSYVNMMSIVRRSQRREFIMMYAVLSAVYVIGIAVEIASSGLYSMELNGIDISHFTRFYSASGIVCAVVCFFASVSNRKDISRVVWHAVCLFVPAAILILVAQLIYVGRGHAVFSATTYVPVFSVGFLLFHNVPYDELSGSQSIYALDAYITKNLGRKKFYISYIQFKVPGIENFVDPSNNALYAGIELCRNIESISPSIRMFKIADDKFVNVIEEADDERAMQYIEKLRAAFDGAKVNIGIPFNYNMISGEVKPELDSILKVRQFFEYVSRRYEDQTRSNFYVAKSSDYDNFAEHFEISTVLKDIRIRQDLDDERVVVYAQPIYSVDTGTFRSAEALMRLKIGDRLIYPDKFIPIAEKSGAVHVLTCIILNKVCQAITQMDDYYDFDAISVNCSSKELSQENMNSDILEIINRYDFNPSKIRLEVTESAMFEDYDMANRNMNALNKTGIQFYLDDFGTGYSSLERVMNCPFKTIKFDKTLLYKSLDDSKMNDIVTYMIEVFKKNGFITLVEGVEDESQNQYSVKHGFDCIQGYHYAKPEPIYEIKRYFSRKNSF